MSGFAKNMFEGLEKQIKLNRTAEKWTVKNESSRLSDTLNNILQRVNNHPWKAQTNGYCYLDKLFLFAYHEREILIHIVTANVERADQKGELLLSFWPGHALSDLSPPEPSPVVESRYLPSFLLDFNGGTFFKRQTSKHGSETHKLEVLSFSTQGSFASLFEYELNFVCPTMMPCSTFGASHSPIYIHFKWIHSCKMFHVA